MRFENQNLLWLLLVLPPALAVFLWWALRQRQKLLTQFIQARLLPALTVGISPTRQKIRAACLFFAVALLIVTLARPQWGFTLEEVKQRGLDIVVAIDTSKSMLVTDIAPNRLARAKLAAFDLMQQAKSDRLGLVAFAGNAFLQCPLTSDETAFRQSVDALDVNIIPQGGTAIAEAIRTALTAFKEGGNYKMLVLLTDGEDNDEGALIAAEAAAKEGLRIFTIGIGTEKGELLRVTDGNGNSDYIRDEQNHVVMSHLNVQLLQQIAGATEGGFYLPLSGAKTMDTLYERGLAPLPKSEHGEKNLRRYREQFYWPLATAILLLLVEILLPERSRKRETVETVSSSNDLSTGLKPGANERKPLINVAALLILLSLPGAAFGSPASALREYNAGKYDNALQEYQRLAERKTNDLRLPFNSGAAAYREKKFDAATNHFSRAISAQDLNLQQPAYYNLGNVLYRIGENDQDEKGKIKSWEFALTNYVNAIKLNTNDADAKFNYDFVKKKLDELKKKQEQQQQQQNQQNQDQQPKQDQQNQKQQNQQNQNQQSQNNQQSQQNQSQQNQQSKSDQQQKQDQQQNQQAKNDQQKQNSQGQNQPDQKQDKQDQKNQQQQQAQNQKAQQDKQGQSSQSQQQNSDGQEKEQQAASYAAGQMTPQEAQRLLDAQKGDEKVLQFKPDGKPENINRPIKDW